MDSDMKRYMDSDMLRYIKGKQILVKQGKITQTEYEILMGLAGIDPFTAAAEKALE